MMDEKGRCCGRQPLYYKGGSWRSPANAPMYFCTTCCREYDGGTKTQIPNWAWKFVNGEFVRQ